MRTGCRPSPTVVAAVVAALLVACTGTRPGGGRQPTSATTTQRPELATLTGADVAGQRLAVYTVLDDTLRFLTSATTDEPVAVRPVQLTTIPRNLVPLGTQLALVFERGAVAVLDPATGTQTRNVAITAADVGVAAGRGFTVDQMRRSPDGRRLWIQGGFAGPDDSHDGVVAELDPATLRVRAAYRFTEPVQYLSVSNTRAVVLLASGRIIDPRQPTRPLVDPFPGSDEAIAVAETPVGLWVSGLGQKGESYLRTPAGVMLPVEGKYNPDTLTALADGGLAVVVRGLDQLWLLTPTGELRARVPVPAQAVDLDVDHTHGLGYVTSAGPADALTIIELSTGSVRRSVHVGPYASLTRVLTSA